MGACWCRGRWSRGSSGRGSRRCRGLCVRMRCCRRGCRRSRRGRGDPAWAGPAPPRGRSRRVDVRVPRRRPPRGHLHIRLLRRPRACRRTRAPKAAGSPPHWPPTAPAAPASALPSARRPSAYATSFRAHVRAMNPACLQQESRDHVRRPPHRQRGVDHVGLLELITILFWRDLRAA